MNCPSLKRAISLYFLLYLVIACFFTKNNFEINFLAFSPKNDAKYNSYLDSATQNYPKRLIYMHIYIYVTLDIDFVWNYIFYMHEK